MILPWITQFHHYVITDLQASPLSLEAYVMDIKQFVAFSCKARQRPLIDGQNKTWLCNDFSVLVEEFLLHLQGNNPGDIQYKATSIARKGCSLRHLMNFLFEKKDIGEDQLCEIPIPKTRRNLPKIIEVETVLELIHYLDHATSPRDIRLKAILEVMYGCGLRVRVRESR